MKISGIYCIKNKINNKIYIGSSKDIYDRWSHHKIYLRKNQHYNNHLQNSWNIYREENFNFLILQECTEDNLTECEQDWINKFDACNPKNGYNKRIIAQNNSGLKHTEETKRKIGEAGKGRKHTEITKQKIGNANRGKKHSLESIEKSRLGNIGRKHSSETKLKMSQKHKNKIVKQETREKLRQATLGKKPSEQTKQKMSQYRLGKKLSEETKQKMRESSRKRWEKYYADKNETL